MDWLMKQCIWQAQNKIRNIKTEKKAIVKAIKDIDWSPIAEYIGKATARTLADNWIITMKQVQSIWLTNCLNLIKNPLAKESFKKFYNTHILKNDDE